MKTLKTISTALSLTLLVSAVSAPAMMPTKMDLAKGSFVAAKNAVVTGVSTAVKATDKVLFGNSDGGGLPVLRSYLRADNGFVRAATVAAIAAVPVVAYKAYSYFTAEEAEEANEPVQNVVPTPVEVTAPVETPAVEAPKAAVKATKKAKRNPFAKRAVKRNVAAKAKAPKAKVAAKAKVAKAPKAKVTRNAGCKNGRCGVRRSK